MGYKIVVPGQFTGTSLAQLKTLGFSDNFNRTDLGTTTTGSKPWGVQYSVANPNVSPNLDGSTLGVQVGEGSNSYGLVAADAETPDVLVEATIAVAPTDSALASNLRLAVRCLSASPARFVSLRWSNVPGQETVYLDSYRSTAAVRAEAPVSGTLQGRRVGLKAIGDQFSVLLDGAEIIAPLTITGLPGITSHGLQINNSASAYRIDDLTVTPV